MGAAPIKIVSRYADTVGDGSGSTAFTGDYSSAAEEAIFKPGATEIYEVHRMIVTVEDGTPMSAAEYGNTNVALTNGITIEVQDDSGVDFELTDANLPVKVNSHWGTYCYDVSVKTWGVGNDFLIARWTFSRSGVPIVLDGKRGAKIVINLNDNFSALADHRFLFQGFIQGEKY